MVVCVVWKRVITAFSVSAATLVSLLIILLFTNATHAGKQWGVFHDTSMKKLFVVYQEEAVTAFEILGEHTNVLL